MRCTSARCAALGRPCSRPRSAAGSTSSARAMPSATARFTPCATPSPSSSVTGPSGPARRAVPAARSTTTSACAPATLHVTTRLPSARQRSASAARPGSSTGSTTARACSVISDFAARIPSLLPIRSRCASPIVVIAATVGREQRAQLADLPRPVGAHLGDEHLCAVHQVVVDRAGQAEPVVEARRRGDHRPARRQQVGDVALGRGLAVRAGDRHHGRSHARQALAGLGDVGRGQALLHQAHQPGREVHRQRHAHREGRGGRWAGQQHQPRAQREHHDEPPGCEPAQPRGPGQRGGATAHRQADRHERAEAGTEQGREPRLSERHEREDRERDGRQRRRTRPAPSATARAARSGSPGRAGSARAG